MFLQRYKEASILFTIYSEADTALSFALSRKSYAPHLRLCTEKKPSHADLFICSERTNALPQNLSCGLFLFPATLTCPPSPSLSALCALSCGMSCRDTLSFSSISEQRALLCLARSLEIFSLKLEPMEVRVPFSPADSLYRNLTRSFCLYFLDTLFSEEMPSLETVHQCREQKRPLSFVP